MVTDAVVNSTLFQTSKCISCYLSMPNGELDTAPLVSAILAAGSSASPSSQQKMSPRVLRYRKGPLRPKAGHLGVDPREDGHAPHVRPVGSRFISVWALGYPRTTARKERRTTVKRSASIHLARIVPEP